MTGARQQLFDAIASIDSFASHRMMGGGATTSLEVLLIAASRDSQKLATALQDPLANNVSELLDAFEASFNGLAAISGNGHYLMAYNSRISDAEIQGMLEKIDAVRDEIGAHYNA